MKKILAVFIAAIMLLPLGSCAGDTVPETTAAETVTEKTTETEIVTETETETEAVTEEQTETEKEEETKEAEKEKTADGFVVSIPIINGNGRCATKHACRFFISFQK